MFIIVCNEQPVKVFKRAEAKEYCQEYSPQLQNGEWNTGKEVDQLPWQ